MLVDANVLLFAVDEASPFHEPAKNWLSERLRGGPACGAALAESRRLPTDLHKPPCGRATPRTRAGMGASGGLARVRGCLGSSADTDFARFTEVRWENLSRVELGRAVPSSRRT